MQVILLLILVSLVLALAFLSAFVWANKDGQFEDEFTPSVRILLPDKKEETEN